jgi:hypothetical protein
MIVFFLLLAIAHRRAGTGTSLCVHFPFFINRYTDSMDDKKDLFAFKISLNQHETLNASTTLE